MSQPLPPGAGVSGRLRAIAASRTARNTLINAAGTGSAAILSFGSLIIATRTMGPAPFGLFALALAVLTMASELADLGVNAGIIRHASFHLGRGDTAAARAVMSVGLRTKLVTAGGGGLLVLALAGPAATLLSRPGAAPLLRIAALGLAGAVLHGMTSAALQAHERFQANALLGVFHWGLRLGGTGLLAATGRLSPAALLWVYALSPWLSFVLGLALAPRGALTLGVWDRERAREVLHFSRWMALWAVFAILLNRVDLLLLGKLSTDTEVGHYAASQRVALLMMLLVNAYVMTLVPHMARMQDRAALRRAMRKAVYVSMLAGAGVVTLLAASPWVVALLGFPAAAPTLRILLVGTLFLVQCLPFNSALYALNRPHYFALEAGLGLAVSVGGNLWLIPRYGARGAAAVFAFVGLMTFGIAVAAAAREIRRPAAVDGGDGDR